MIDEQTYSEDLAILIAHLLGNLPAEAAAAALDCSPTGLATWARAVATRGELLAYTRTLPIAGALAARDDCADHAPAQERYPLTTIRTLYDLAAHMRARAHRSASQIRADAYLAAAEALDLARAQMEEARQAGRTPQEAPK